MPIGGHPPGLDGAFRLRICPPCRAGDHPSCRPFIDKGRLMFCECLGWDLAGVFPTVLPCLKEKP